MRTRIELDDILRSICPNVYYQPPETIKMKYPCIMYSLQDFDSRNADDIKYKTMSRYSVTIVDKNPDCPMLKPMINLPYCSFDRGYTADNLNHFVFTLYF